MNLKKIKDNLTTFLIRDPTFYKYKLISCLKQKKFPDPEVITSGQAISASMIYSDDKEYKPVLYITEDSVEYTCSCMKHGKNEKPCIHTMVLAYLIYNYVCKKELKEKDETKEENFDYPYDEYEEIKEKKTGVPKKLIVDPLQEVINNLKSKEDKNKFKEKIEIFGLYQYDGIAVLKPLTKTNTNNYTQVKINTKEYISAPGEIDSLYERGIKKLVSLRYWKEYYYQNQNFLRLNSFEELKKSGLTVLFGNSKLITFDKDIFLNCKIRMKGKMHEVEWYFTDEDKNILNVYSYAMYKAVYDCAFMDSKKRFRVLRINGTIDLKNLEKNIFRVGNSTEFYETRIKPLKKAGVLMDMSGCDFDYIDEKPVFNLYIKYKNNNFYFTLKIKYGENEYYPNELDEVEHIIRDEETESQLFANLERLNIELYSSEPEVYDINCFGDFLKEKINLLDERINVIYDKKIVYEFHPKITVSGKNTENWFDTDIRIENEKASNYLSQIKNDRYLFLKSGKIFEIPEYLQKFIIRHGNKNKYRIYELTEFMENSDGDLKDAFEKLRNFDGIESYPLPELKGKMRDYQIKGYNYLRFLNEYNISGILADDMGLGKTLQAIAILKSCKNDKQNLVVTPKSVIYNWAAELEKFSDMSYNMYFGQNRKIDKTKEIILTTYATLRNSEELFNHDFNYIILDEAQYIKNDFTKTSKSVKALKSDYRLALTGTPIENSLIDIYNIFEFLMPGFLTKKDFKETKENREEIKRKIKPFILRRKKEQVLKELPPKIEDNLIIEMDSEQETIYNRLLKEIKTKLDKVEDKNYKFSVLEGLLRLRQVVCHPKLVFNDYEGTSGKMEELKDFLEDVIESGHKVIIFSQFVKMLEIIKEYLEEKEINYEIITGATQDRFEITERFNEDESIKIMLASMKAGGTGLNITGADYVIHFDPWWNPAVENQATDRTHRIGQEKTVFVYKMVTKNSIEEKIMKLKEEKLDLYNEIIDDESIFRTLTREDIQKLFEQ